MKGGLAPPAGRVSLIGRFKRSFFGLGLGQPALSYETESWPIRSKGDDIVYGQGRLKGYRLVVDAHQALAGKVLYPVAVLEIENLNVFAEDSGLIEHKPGLRVAADGDGDFLVGADEGTILNHEGNRDPLHGQI